MCGIAGFWQSKRGFEPPEALLVRMGAALKHRGPDDSGTLFDSSAGLGLVHRRLSILDLTPAGRQPMSSVSGRYKVVFNGELYNFESIRSELGQSLAWRGHSDTEVLLAAIEFWGLDSAVQKFVGMFAFALWDKVARKLHLVRDRLGIKPVYYGWVGGDFVFASELKAIRQYADFRPEIDRNSLALYLRHNCVPAPHTIYRGFSKLPPGSILTLGSPQEQPEVRCFWSVVQVAEDGLRRRFNGTEAEGIEELETKLREAIAIRMIADVPLGAFLSGGIDSSTVVALMQAQSSRPVKTYTIGFREDAYNEAAHAKRVAAHLGTDHTELFVSPKDALDVVPQLPHMYDEPFSDASQIPTFLVSKLARTAVTVSLSGDGGDELFGGYNRHYLMPQIWKILKRVPVQLRRMGASAIRAVSATRIDAAYQFAGVVLPREKRWSAVGDRAHKLAGFLDAQDMESLYLRALSHWTDPTDIVPDSTEPERITASIRSLDWLPTFEEVMMLTDLANYLPDDILTKVDRASMAVSLEARVPLLDHRVVEFAWRLPLHFKIRDGLGKWALRQVLYKYVPKSLVERPKMGFGIPIERWLRGPLRDWAEDLLSEQSLASHGLLNPKPIRRLWREHLSQAGNWQYHIWDVLVFQDWFRHSAVSQPGPVSTLS
jgi:asparagine synthase (glutamine-hydrolysing)